MHRIYKSIFIIAMALLPSACSAQQKIDIAFTGDIMMHYAVKGTALVHSNTDEKNYTVPGFEYLFEKTAPVLKAADFAIGNMEFPVSPPFIQDEFIFNCPKEVIPALKNSGFYAVSLANNHLLDQKNKGVTDTLGYLEEAKLNYFGAARTEAEARGGIIVEKDGFKVGIISYTGLLNYPFPEKNDKFHLNNLNLSEQVCADIAALKKRCDFVIAQPHAGVEYVQAPTEEQRKLYKKMIDAGADLIVGHHPHILQYTEEYKSRDGRTCAIFYSLGNFICNQNYCYPVPGTKSKLDIREGFILNVSLTKNAAGITQQMRVIPIYTEHVMKKGKTKEYKDIQTIIINDEIKKLQDELKGASAKRKNDIALAVTAYEARKEIIKKVLFRKGPVANVTMD